MPSLTYSSRNASRRNINFDSEQNDSDCSQISNALPALPPAPSTCTDSNQSYLNKMIIIIGGKSIGLKGRVMKIEKRGWWTIDNPLLAGKKITGKLCRLISSMPTDHVKRYEAMAGSPHREGNQLVSQPTGLVNSMVDGNDVVVNSKYGKRPKRRTSFKTYYSSQVKKSKIRVQTNIKIGESLTFPFSSSERTDYKKNRQTDSDQRETGMMESKTNLPHMNVCLRPMQSNHLSVSHPLILGSNDNHTFFQNGESFTYAYPDTVVDIFNRKTGRVMRCEHGIKIKDLAAALRSHSEYEPLVSIPSSHSTSKKEAGACKLNSRLESNRQKVESLARSSNKTKVGRFIQPQPSVHNTVSQGCIVLVKTGSNRGLIGKVDLCDHWGWCMISDFLDTDYRNPCVSIHSQHLKVVTTKHETEVMSIGVGGREEWNNYNVNTNTKKKNNRWLDKPRLKPTHSWIDILKLEKERKMKYIQHRSKVTSLSEKIKNKDDIVNAQASLKIQQLTEQMLKV